MKNEKINTNTNIKKQEIQKILDTIIRDYALSCKVNLVGEIASIKEPRDEYVYLKIPFEKQDYFFHITQNEIHFIESAKTHAEKYLSFSANGEIKTKKPLNTDSINILKEAGINTENLRIGLYLSGCNIEYAMLLSKYINKLIRENKNTKVLF